MGRTRSVPLPEFRVGCTYELYAREGGPCKGTVTVVASTIEPHVFRVRSGKTEQTLDLTKYARTVRARASVRRARSRTVYLYLVDLGHGQYKVGASSDPERRARQLRTGAARARLLSTAALPADQSRLFRTFERRVLDEFAGRGPLGGGTEVLSLSPAEVERCRDAMRRAVA